MMFQTDHRHPPASGAGEEKLAWDRGRTCRGSTRTGRSLGPPLETSADTGWHSCPLYRYPPAAPPCDASSLMGGNNNAQHQPQVRFKGVKNDVHMVARCGLLTKNRQSVKRMGLNRINWFVRLQPLAKPPTADLNAATSNSSGWYVEPRWLRASLRGQLKTHILSSNKIKTQQQLPFPPN